MNLLKGKGLWYGIIGGVGGIFGSVALALDKGSLCLILSGFDTLPEEEFVGLIPYLQVIIDKAGLISNNKPAIINIPCQRFTCFSLISPIV